MSSGDESSERASVTEEVISGLLENFDCQPVLFIGAGLARRYLGAPDWEGVLRHILSILPESAPSYEYLAQKFDNDLISIGSELTDLVFEWAWSEGRSQFPDELFSQENKSVFLKHLLAELLTGLTPDDMSKQNPEFADEFSALQAIRPHALITTNYDQMLEKLFPGYEGIVGKQVLRYNLNAYGEVYHIHGSVTDPSTIVINRDDYTRWINESKYFAEKLLTYFAEHPVIVLGYSLSDTNVRVVLEDIGAIAADETGLIANVLQVIYDEKIEGNPVQTEIAIPVNGSQYRIKALQTPNLIDVFKALTARHELRDVNPALVRALAARAMKLTRSDIPSGNIEVDYQTLEGIVDSDDALPTLLGITQADDVNKSHPYTLSIVGEKLGFNGWNGAHKLLQKIKNDKGVDIRATDNQYHCAVKVGKKDTSLARKYSEALVVLLEKVREGKVYQVKL